MSGNVSFQCSSEVCPSYLTTASLSYRSQSSSSLFLPLLPCGTRREHHLSSYKKPQSNCTQHNFTPSILRWMLHVFLPPLPPPTIPLQQVRSAVTFLLLILQGTLEEGSSWAGTSSTTALVCPDTSWQRPALSSRLESTALRVPWVTKLQHGALLPCSLSNRPWEVSLQNLCCLLFS